MKRCRGPLRHGVCLIFAWLTLQVAAPSLCPGADNSLRLDLNFDYTINSKFKSINYAFIQADKDRSNYDYGEIGTGLQYQTSLKWLSVLLYYQQGYAKDAGGRWGLEQKPSINLNTVGTLAGFNIANQIRYEYRMTPDWNDYRIKNTLGISRPDIFLKPFIGWELFYENIERDVTLSRIRFGVVKDINEHISVGPYYRIDYAYRNNSWEFVRQLVGFQLNLKY